MKRTARMRIKYPLIFLLFLITTSATQAATYYLRADGTARDKSAATACDSASTAMSVATHNKQRFSPGDVIALCDDGGVYKESIIVPSSGSDGNPIVYRNAKGDKPIIDLSMDIGSSGWKPMGNGVYRKKGYGRVLWEDDVPLKAASDESLKDGEWFYPIGSNKLYYKPTSGNPSNHRIKTIWFGGGWAPYAIDLRNRSNIEISGFTIKRVGGGIGHGADKGKPVSQIKNIVIHNNNISYCMWGIWSQVFDDGVQSDVYIHHNTISFCNSGISAWTGSDTKPGHMQHNKRFKITNNRILNLYSITDDKVWSDALLTSYYYTDHEGISFQDVQDSLIADNIITNTYSKDMTSDQYWCRAITLFLTNGEIYTSGNLILRNKISGHYYPSIYIATSKGFKGLENNIIAYNSIHYSLADKGQISFIVNTASDNPLKGKNYFIHNTVVNDREGIGISMNNKWAGNWVINNNIIVSPHLVHLNKNNISGNITTGHNIYLSKASWGFLHDAAGLTFPAWKKYGHAEKGSQFTDPLFVSENDFHLKSDSPAIDAGLVVDILKDPKDIEGKPIVGKPDIGTYEYQE